jgi:hypothetical protein
VAAGPPGLGHVVSSRALPGRKRSGMRNLAISSEVSQCSPLALDAQNGSVLGSA